jgi:hypothetical protein
MIIKDVKSEFDTCILLHCFGDLWVEVILCLKLCILFLEL